MGLYFLPYPLANPNLFFVPTGPAGSSKIISTTDKAADNIYHANHDLISKRRIQDQMTKVSKAINPTPTNTLLMQAYPAWLGSLKPFGDFPDAKDFIEITRDLSDNILTHDPMSDLSTLLPLANNEGDLNRFPSGLDIFLGTLYQPNLVGFSYHQYGPSTLANPFSSTPFGTSPSLFPTSTVPTATSTPFNPLPGLLQSPVLLGSFPLPQTVFISPFQDQSRFLELILRQIAPNTVFPDVVPTNAPGGLSPFLLNFASAPTATQTTLRTQLANPTTLDPTILNSFNITTTGGTFNQGVVTNPFLQANFLADTNPFARFQSGLLFTSDAANASGGVLGSPVSDILFGRPTAQNVIAGQGGLDQIIAGEGNDLIQAVAGDRLDARGGNDTLFLNLAASANNPFRFPTFIEGGAGSDTLVIPVSGNPTLAANQPTVQTVGSNAFILQLNGQQVWANSIERILITDAQGNIGRVFGSAS